MEKGLSSMYDGHAEFYFAILSEILLCFLNCCIVFEFLFAIIHVIFFAQENCKILGVKYSEINSLQFYHCVSVQFSRSVVSDSL